MLSKALITPLKAWSLYQIIFLSLEEAILVFYLHTGVHSQSCLILCDRMDCGPPGFSVRGVLQARIVERAAMPSSQRCSGLRDGTPISPVRGIGRRALDH